MPLHRPFKQVDANGIASYFCVTCDCYKLGNEFYRCAIAVSHFYFNPPRVLAFWVCTVNALTPSPQNWIRCCRRCKNRDNNAWRRRKRRSPSVCILENLRNSYRRRHRGSGTNERITQMTHLDIERILRAWNNRSAFDPQATASGEITLALVSPDAAISPENLVPLTLAEARGRVLRRLTTRQLSVLRAKIVRTNAPLFVNS